MSINNAILTNAYTQYETEIKVELALTNYARHWGNHTCKDGKALTKPIIMNYKRQIR